MSVSDYDGILEGLLKPLPAKASSGTADSAAAPKDPNTPSLQAVLDSTQDSSQGLRAPDEQSTGTTEVEAGDDDDASDVEENQPARIKKIIELIEIQTDYGSQVIRDRRRKPKIRKGKHDDYTGVVRRIVTAQGITESTALEIISPYLRKVMRHVLKDFPDLNLEANCITLPKMYRPLFYKLDALRQLRDDEPVGATRDELELIVDFAQSNLDDVLQSYKQHVEFDRITAKLVWTLFPPGEIIYQAPIGQKPAQCFLVKSCKHEANMGGIWTTSLILSSWSWKGAEFKISHRMYYMNLPDSAGAMRITDLPFFPLKYHKEETEVRSKLIDRGKKYAECVKFAHMTYNGVAWGVDPMEQFKQTERYISSRVVIDHAMFARENPKWPEITEDTFPDNPCSCGSPTCQVDQKKSEDVAERAAHALIELEDEKRSIEDGDALLAPATVHGFALQEKVWVALRLDRLEVIEWNSEAYTRLEVEDSLKKSLQALVGGHRKHSPGHKSDFDDVIAGKGLGLVFLLSGEPGLGKTLTAETVAEVSKKPLYSVTSGELGTDVESMEQALQKAFRVARDWDAILLLDEADVFLTRRSNVNFERNAFVSIFLRMMEYYRGILFLTTNRKQDFDDAFMSRIHLAVEYPPLSEHQRERIWKSLAMKLDVSDELQEEGFARLARELELNGREIKNLLRTGWSLVKHEREVSDGSSDCPQLTTEHLLTVAKYRPKITGPGGDGISCH